MEDESEVACGEVDVKHPFVHFSVVTFLPDLSPSALRDLVALAFKQSSVLAGASLTGQPSAVYQRLDQRSNYGLGG